MTDLLGYLAAILTTASFLPQVIRVYRTRSVEDISTTMYVGFLCGVSLWLWYGIRLNSLPLMLANGTTFLLAGAVLVGKFRFGGRDAAEGQGRS